MTPAPTLRQGNAAVLLRPKEPLTLVSRELPAPPAGQVAVRIEACGFGLGDWHVAMLDALPKLPWVLGQEAVGVVEQVGQGVDLVVGARVGITPLASSCGRCGPCERGLERYCAQSQWHGVTCDGALCERGNFWSQHLVAVPPGDAAELAALMGSGWAALGAVRAAGAGAGVALGVFGLGGVGHLALQLAAACGAQVTGIEPSAERAALGAPHRVLAPSVLGRAHQATLDAAVVCVPSTQAVQQALAMLRPAGALVLAAASPSGRVDLPLRALAERGIAVQGSVLGARSAMGELLSLYAAGAVKPHVARRPLREAAEALYQLRDGGFAGRLVLVP